MGGENVMSTCHTYNWSVWVWSQHGEGAKIKTTKISSEGLTCNSTKFCCSENFPLYGIILNPVSRLTNVFYTGGWGLLNGSTTSNWNINGQEFLSEKRLGSPAFFTMDITIDDKNSSQYILEVCITNHGFYAAYYGRISTSKAVPVWSNSSRPW
jgi:hypothetical protein